MSDLSRTIRTAVLEAAREHAILHSPACVHEFMPPHDRDAEERIVSAILCGHTTLAAIRPLTAPDFFCPLPRAVMEALAAVGTVEDVTAAVTAELERRVCGPIAEQVIELRDGVPFVLDLRDHVSRVHELSRRRRLSAFLSELQLAVTVGDVTADEAIAKMRSALERARRAA